MINKDKTFIHCIIDTKIKSALVKKANANNIKLCDYIEQIFKNTLADKADKNGNG